MEKYTKPSLIAQANIKGIVPLAAVGAAVAGLSAAELAGAAAVAGMAVGMASSQGSDDIMSYRAQLILQE